jgi:hypothetical protein
MKAIPPSNAELTAVNLAAWVRDKNNAASLHGYARRVVPIDMAFLLTFGIFLATAAKSADGLRGQVAYASVRLPP